MELQIRRLRYFLAVADELNFSRAAERLHVAQPPLSQQIRKLESELGATLFDRSTHHVALTPAGRVLVDHARDLLARADAAVSDVRRAGGAGIGQLTVGFVGVGAGDLTPLVLASFALSHPDIVVSMTQYPLSTTDCGLRSGEVDVAFLWLPVDDTELSVAPLLDEPRVAVLPAGHPLAGSTCLRFEQLVDEPFVISRSEDPVWRDFWMVHDQRGGVATRIGASTETPDEGFAAIVGGRGVGIAPASMQRYYTQTGARFVPIVDIPPATLALGWRRGVLSAAAADFVATTKSVLGAWREGVATAATPRV